MIKKIKKFIILHFIIFLAFQNLYHIAVYHMIIKIKNFIIFVLSYSKYDKIIFYACKSLQKRYIFFILRFIIFLVIKILYHIALYHILRKTKFFIIRIMVFPLDDNFVFGDNFFSWLIIFFSPKATKKITQPRKKITHQQTKLLIQRKHHYTYDMTFLCHPPLKICWVNTTFFLIMGKTA